MRATRHTAAESRSPSSDTATPCEVAAGGAPYAGRHQFSAGVAREGRAGERGRTTAMPTVLVPRDRLFEALGRRYTDEEFDEVCFAYGLELDDVVVEDGDGDDDDDVKEAANAELGGVDGDVDRREADRSVCYKIEVPANRYDLLCFEGIVQALRVFLRLDAAPPRYRLSGPPRETLVVAPSTAAIRPYVVAAVLRDIDLRGVDSCSASSPSSAAAAASSARYRSLIDLQEKLHQNICRRRELVAIGTHDLDAVRGPFRYEALPPRDIRFRPLNAPHELDGEQLMRHYEDPASADGKHLRKYLPIIRDSPVYPVIFDDERRVLSLPPIINGERSRVRPSTRNLLIECTATDLNKAHTVLNTIVAMFSRYAGASGNGGDGRFAVEPVAVRYEQAQGDAPAGEMITPSLDGYEVEARLAYVERLLGVQLGGVDALRDCLARMQLELLDADERPSAAAASAASTPLRVRVPVTRSDVLHACDVAEDVAVAYGFDRIEERAPSLATQGGQQALNQLSDQMRREFAQQGYVEVLNWVTVSHAENFDMLQRVHGERQRERGAYGAHRAVCIGNPKTLEFQECRTSLLSGLLKTLRENRMQPLPLRLFEVGDVVLLHETADGTRCDGDDDDEEQEDERASEVGARNERRAAAVYMNTSAEFEVMKHLLDRVMQALECRPQRPQQASGDSNNDDSGIGGGGYRTASWWLDPHKCTDDLFLAGRRANVLVQRGAREANGARVVGVMGWIHPRVLEAFGLSAPVSALEITLQRFGRAHHGSRQP